MARKLIAALLLLMFFCGCSGRQDAVYSQVLSEAGNSSQAGESDSPSEVMSGEEAGENSAEVHTELHGTLSLRTYIGRSSVDIWKSYIEEFQETYPNISIEVVDSDAFSDPDAYISRTTVALLSGDAGDILDMNYLPVLSYSASGVLAPLGELMEKAPGFSLDDYYTNVFDAYRYQGKLYSLPYEFDLVGTWLNKSIADQLDFKAADRIQITDLLRLYEKAKVLPNAPEPFYLSSFVNWNSLNAFGFSSSVNEQEKTAAFTSEAFLEYLKLLKTIDYSERAGNGGGPGTMPAVHEALQSNELGVLVTLPLGSRTGMQFLLEEAGSQQVTPFLPLETDQGEGFFSAKNLAVTSACQEKEAAFAFLQFMLDDDRKLSEENYMHSDLGHVNRRLNRRFLEEVLGEENGELVNRIDAWCEQVSMVTFYDRSPELYNRLCEICNEYMNELISAEECAQKMQERAEIYLKE